jgi:hypothetical protein
MVVPVSSHMPGCPIVQMYFWIRGLQIALVNSGHWCPYVMCSWRWKQGWQCLPVCSSEIVHDSWFTFVFFFLFDVFILFSPLFTFSLLLPYFICPSCFYLYVFLNLFLFLKLFSLEFFSFYSNLFLCLTSVLRNFPLPVAHPNLPNARDGTLQNFASRKADTKVYTAVNVYLHTNTYTIRTQVYKNEDRTHLGYNYGW